MTKKREYVSNYHKPYRLGKEAGLMWDEVMQTFELRRDECRLLVDICREIDVVNYLFREMESAPSTVKGSQGQPVANPLLAELRQHRLALAQLIKQLKLDGRTVVGAKSSAEASAANVVKLADKWRTVGA